MDAREALCNDENRTFWETYICDGLACLTVAWGGSAGIVSVNRRLVYRGTDHLDQTSNC